MKLILTKWANVLIIEHLLTYSYGLGQDLKTELTTTKNPRRCLNQKKLHGGSRRFRPRNANKSPRKEKKRALEKKKKRAPENCHRLQCKSLFNVADLVSGMWKVAPENTKIIFGLAWILPPPPPQKKRCWLIMHLAVFSGRLSTEVSIQRTPNNPHMTHTSHDPKPALSLS